MGWYLPEIGSKYRSSENHKIYEIVKYDDKNKKIVYMRDEDGETIKTTLDQLGTKFEDYVDHSISI